MSGISEDQMAEFRDAYCLFDRIGDGKIDGDQIEDLLRSMGLNPQGSDLKQVREDYKGKRVQIEEWLGIYTQFRSKPEPVREDFIEAFKCYDRDGSGTIDGASLRGMLCHRGDSKLTEDEANELLAPLEDVQKGVINYEEIIKLIRTDKGLFRYCDQIAPGAKYYKQTRKNDIVNCVTNQPKCMLCNDNDITVMESFCEQMHVHGEKFIEGGRRNKSIRKR